MWDISILLLLGAGILWGRSNGRYCLSKLLLHIPDSERKKWISSVTASDLISPFVFLPLSISVCTSPSSTSLAPSLALSLSFYLPFISSSHLSVSLYLSFFISVFNLLFSLLSLLLCISLFLLLFLSLLYGPLHLSSSLSSVFVTLLWVTHLLPMFLSSSLCSCLLFPCLLSVLSWSLSLSCFHFGVCASHSSGAYTVSPGLLALITALVRATPVTHLWVSWGGCVSLFPSSVLSLPGWWEHTLLPASV